MTITTTERVPGRLNAHLIKTCACDLGNRGLKILDRKNLPKIFPSYYLKLEDYDDLPRANSTSVVVVDGSDRYVLGSLAKSMKGTPIYQTSKTAMASRLVAAAIEPFEGSDLPIFVETLRLVLPDSRKAEQFGDLKALEGTTKNITRNGVDITFSIGKVEVIDECLPSFWYAKTSKLLNYPYATTGILDVGGGTVLARLITPDGQIIRKADVSLPGTYDLAREINAFLLPRIGSSTELGLLMDAIANSSFAIGATGISFKKEFLAASQKWVAGIRSQLKESWEPFKHDIGDVLITGGSAPLMQSLEVSSGGRFRVLPNSQFVQLKGMAIGGTE
jgi:hypothetical protein